MAQSNFCKSDGDVLKPRLAMEREVRDALFQELLEATARANAASAAFKKGIAEGPRLAPSEAIKRIDMVSRELALARRDMERAHHRLEDFLRRGIVPEYLKHSPRQAAATV